MWLLTELADEDANYNTLFPTREALESYVCRACRGEVIRVYKVAFEETLEVGAVGGLSVVDKSTYVNVYPVGLAATVEGAPTA